MSWSPTTGLMYIPGQENSFVFRSDPSSSAWRRLGTRRRTVGTAADRPSVDRCTRAHWLARVPRGLGPGDADGAMARPLPHAREQRHARNGQEPCVPWVRPRPLCRARCRDR
jgi:hypothetical protein